jgi:hypothetical protein
MRQIKCLTLLFMLSCAACIRKQNMSIEKQRDVKFKNWARDTVQMFQTYHLTDSMDVFFEFSNDSLILSAEIFRYCENPDSLDKDFIYFYTKDKVLSLSDFKLIYFETQEYYPGIYDKIYLGNNHLDYFEYIVGKDTFHIDLIRGRLPNDNQ